MKEWQNDWGKVGETISEQLYGKIIVNIDEKMSREALILYIEALEEGEKGAYLETFRNSMLEFAGWTYSMIISFESEICSKVINGEYESRKIKDLSKEELEDFHEEFMTWGKEKIEEVINKGLEIYK